MVVKLSGLLGFIVFNCEIVFDYVALKENVVKVLGGVLMCVLWLVKEIGDGNINFVYIVIGVFVNKFVIVK